MLSLKLLYKYIILQKNFSSVSCMPSGFLRLHWNFINKPLNFILLGEIKEVVYLMYSNWHLPNISYP